MGLLMIFLFGVFMVVVVVVIVYMECVQWCIFVQYVKCVVGWCQFGGQSIYFLFKVNIGGVIFVIFVSLIVMVLVMLVGFIDNLWMQKILDVILWGQLVYYLFYIVVIIFFCFFYVLIIFNLVDLVENMCKYGGFIFGICLGCCMVEYIDCIFICLIFVGVFYFLVILVLLEFLFMGFKVLGIFFIGVMFDQYILSQIMQGFGINFYFGGILLLIVVGVVMDLLQQIESQLVMCNYDGFMKKGCICGCCC